MLASTYPKVENLADLRGPIIVLHTHWIIKCIVNGRVVPFMKFILSPTQTPVPSGLTVKISKPCIFPFWHPDEVGWVMNTCSALIYEGVAEESVPP